MDPALLLQVCPSARRAKPARLAGYFVSSLHGLPYPGAISRAGSEAEGWLIEVTGAAAWAQLDEYEGEAYQRTACRALAGGREVDAWLYVLRPAFERLCTGKRWRAGGGRLG